MDSHVLLAADVNESTLADLLSRVQIPEDACGWLDFFDSWRFKKWFELKNDTDLTQTIMGRIFASSGELRWRAIPFLNDSIIRVVFLGSCLWDGLGNCLQDCSNELLGCTPQSQEILLWGKRDKTDKTISRWIERKIPHHLYYPIESPSSPYAAIETQVWISDRDGQIQWMRFCQIKESEM